MFKSWRFYLRSRFQRFWKSYCLIDYMYTSWQIENFDEDTCDESILMNELSCFCGKDLKYPDVISNQTMN